MNPLILAAGAAAVCGVAAGYGVKTYRLKQLGDSAETQALKTLEEAKAKAKELILESKTEALKVAEGAKKDEAEKRRIWLETENRLSSREETVDKKLEQLDKRTESLRASEVELTDLKNEIKAIRDRQMERLEKIAKLTKKEAEDRLLAMTEKSVKEDMIKLIEKLQAETVELAEDNAREILVAAMERMASEQTAEKTVTAVPLPDDEMKGRIIGKEGRNIQALERATGVDLIVDETPGVVVLSSFDPIRRQVARVALEKLMSDGRIHPSRIEETVDKARAEIDKIIKAAGEEAAKEAGVIGLPPDMLKTLGSLKFRTSYGQNVLKHSVEMSQMAGMIAAEIGADVRICKTAALIHDIGKALTHEMDEAHHHISRKIAEQHGLEEAIAHAAEAHHDDVEATTPEAMVVRVVDSLSAARPGARGDTLENYVKRMTELETLTNAFAGVSKSYAVSAGREIRILVTPEEVDDLSAIKMARDIATKIEATLKYPGTIKVNVIRETRVVEYAK